MLYIGFALSLNGEESLKKLSDPDSDIHQNEINSSSSHTQLVHRVLSESVPNFMRYRAIYRFFCPQRLNVSTFCPQRIQRLNGEESLLKF